MTALEAALTRLMRYMAASWEHTNEARTRAVLSRTGDWAYYRQWPIEPFNLYSVIRFFKRRGIIVGPEGSTIAAHRVVLLRRSL